MKAGIFFTGTGPILILTSHESLNNPKLLERREICISNKKIFLGP